VFAQYARCLIQPHGMVLTYSQARVVKQAMAQAGFNWQKTCTPLGGKAGGLMGVIEGSV
jgi:tRNA U34 5-methylaminomethyl-2-thiouridine-forming methyltransferase MnmC